MLFVGFYRIVEATIWTFVVVISAYYNGALTMFLASAPYVPFQTVEEGLLTGETSLVTVRGTGAELDFVNKSDVTVRERLRAAFKDGYPHMVQNYDEGMRIMEKKPGTFMFGPSYRFLRSDEMQKE